MYIHIYIHTYVCVSIYTNTHTHTHTHIYTCNIIYIQSIYACLSLYLTLSCLPPQGIPSSPNSSHHLELTHEQALVSLKLKKTIDAEVC